MNTHLEKKESQLFVAQVYGELFSLQVKRFDDF